MEKTTENPWKAVGLDIIYFFAVVVIIPARETTERAK